MLWNDDLLNGVNVLFFWSVVGLNVFGLMVTQVLGSVFRAVMLTARTASVSTSPDACSEVCNSASQVQQVVPTVVGDPKAFL